MTASTPPSPRETLVMAVLNCTPDSFSDGGRYSDIDAILDAAKEALGHGAHILDVGGESTRPGAEVVDEAEEISWVVPVIEALREGFPDAMISIDTRKAAVAQAAVAAGADIINDVSGLQYDPAMAETAAACRAALILMHSQGTPETMQFNPTYGDVVTEVCDFLSRQAERAIAAGVSKNKIWLDPGFGFGKNLEHNLALLRNLTTLKQLGYPVLVGTSRKSFLTLGDQSIPPGGREALTAASLAAAIQQQVDAVRVHDIKTQGPVVRLLDRLYR